LIKSAGTILLEATIHGAVCELRLFVFTSSRVFSRYVFINHAIEQLYESDESLVYNETMPTPSHIHDAITLAFNPRHNDRSVFVSAQWALGGEGTGAPVHFHNTAWSALAYGAKKWTIYPPHHAIMSNEQILEFYEHSRQHFADRGIKGLTCVQTAGDSMLIPEMWGHGVLNIQESIVVASGKQMQD
jgi:hypothetical protein